MKASPGAATDVSSQRAGFASSFYQIISLLVGGRHSH